MNRRKYIRAYIIERLIAAELVEGRIYSCRRYPLADDELPALAVNIDHEQSELSSESGTMIKKTAQLSIEVIADASDSAADAVIDRLTSKIEELLHFDESFNDSINRAYLKNTEISYMRDGEVELGIARMNYEVTYFSTPPVGTYSDFTGATVTVTNSEIL